MSLDIDRIEMIGHPDAVAFGGPSISNIDNGIIIQGGSGPEQVEANVSITGSRFDRVAFAVLQLVPCLGCDIVFGGPAAVDGNTFSSQFGYGLFAPYLSDSSVVFSHNRGETVRGVAAGSLPPIPVFPPGEPSRIKISNNDLEMFGTVPRNGLPVGVSLADNSLAFGGPQVIHALVENNSFRMIDLGFGADGFFGIFNLVANDTIIRNNRIRGNFSRAGIAAGFAGPLAIGQNLSIIGNNLTGTTAGVAPIWLGAASSDSIVVGRSKSDQVLDQGTDNILTGVNNMNGNPPGPELQETIEQIQGFGYIPGQP